MILIAFNTHSCFTKSNRVTPYMISHSIYCFTLKYNRFEKQRFTCYVNFKDNRMPQLNKSRCLRLSFFFKIKSNLLFLKINIPVLTSQLKLFISSPTFDSYHGFVFHLSSRMSFFWHLVLSANPRCSVFLLFPCCQCAVTHNKCTARDTRMPKKLIQPPKPGLLPSHLEISTRNAEWLQSDGPVAKEKTELLLNTVPFFAGAWNICFKSAL